MAYTYQVIGPNSYQIQGDGKNIIEINEAPFFFPYAKETIEASAEAHIDSIIADEQAVEREQNTIAQLQQLILSQQEQIDALVLAQLMQGGSL